MQRPVYIGSGVNRICTEHTINCVYPKSANYCKVTIRQLIFRDSAGMRANEERVCILTNEFRVCPRHFAIYCYTVCRSNGMPLSSRWRISIDNCQSNPFFEESRIEKSHQEQIRFPNISRKQSIHGNSQSKLVID